MTTALLLGLGTFSPSSSCPCAILVVMIRALIFSPISDGRNKTAALNDSWVLCYFSTLSSLEFSTLRTRNKKENILGVCCHNCYFLIIWSVIFEPNSDMFLPKLNAGNTGHQKRQSCFSHLKSGRRWERGSWRRGWHKGRRRKGRMFLIPGEEPSSSSARLWQERIRIQLTGK